MKCMKEQERTGRGKVEQKAGGESFDKIMVAC